MIGCAIVLLIGLAIAGYCHETQVMICGPKSVVTSANYRLSRTYAYLALLGIIIASTGFVGLIPYLDGLS